MFGRLFVASLLLCLMACAKPKYETVIQAQPEGDGKVEKVSECQTRFLNSGYCVLWAWEKRPTTTEKGVFRFKIVRPNLLDDSAIPVDFEKDPAVVLWMPDMGHSSSPTKVERIDQGSYRVSNVFFIMPGQWQIRFQILNGNRGQDEAVVDYTF